MRIAFYIQKGGVGKTTLTANIGYLLSKKGKTALIDADPQGSLSEWFLGEEYYNEENFELADVIREYQENKNSLMEQTLVEVRDNLSIIPTNPISDKLKNYTNMYVDGKPYTFIDIAEYLETALGYEYILFDTHPEAGKLERTVIKACDEVVTPITPENLSISGLKIVRKTINEEKDFVERQGKNLIYDKIVINKVNKSFKRHNAIVKKLKENKFDCYIVGQDSKLAECSIGNETVFEYSKESRSQSQLKNIADILAKKKKSAV